MFQKLRFLSLRYSADFRRSHLVLQYYTNFRRYIQLYYVLLRRRHRLENSVPICPSTLYPNFDVIIEVYCVSLKRKSRYEHCMFLLSKILKSRLYLNYRLYIRRKLSFTKEVLSCGPECNIRKLEAFFEHKMHPLGVQKLFCEFFIKNGVSMFQKLRFLSLRYSADSR